MYGSPFYDIDTDKTDLFKKTLYKLLYLFCQAATAPYLCRKKNSSGCH